MADLVQRVGSVEEQVGRIIAETIGEPRAERHHRFSVLRFAHAVFDFFAPASKSISASEQYALIDGYRRYKQA